MRVLSLFDGISCVMVALERAGIPVEKYTAFDNLVLEPCDGYYNCPYSKEDMMKRIVPCIIVVPASVADSSWHDDFKYWVGADGVTKIYFGDDEEDLLKSAHLYPMEIGGIPK